MLTYISNRFLSMSVHPCLTAVLMSEQHITVGCAIGTNHVSVVVLLQSKADRHGVISIVLQSASDLHEPDAVETAIFLQKGLSN